MADSLFTSVYFATQSQTVSVARCVLPSVAAFTLVLRYNAGLTRGEMGSQLVVFTMFQPIISGVTSQYRPRDYANVGTSVVLLFGPGDVLIVTGTLFSPSIALSVPVTALQGRGLGVTYDCGPVTLLSSSTSPPSSLPSMPLMLPRLLEAVSACPSRREPPPFSNRV